MPGIIGGLQACEAIKIVTGIGEPLLGRLLLYDALHCETRVLRVTKNDDNPISGKNPTITCLTDLEHTCNAGGGNPALILTDYAIGC